MFCLTAVGCGLLPDLPDASLGTCVRGGSRVLAELSPQEWARFCYCEALPTEEAIAVCEDGSRDLEGARSLDEARDHCVERYSILYDTSCTATVDDLVDHLRMPLCDRRRSPVGLCLPEDSEVPPEPTGGGFRPTGG